jgi:hypothetical protein
MEDAERTNDRQTCIKLGPGMLGFWMATHNSLIASFISLLFVLLLFSYSIKALLLKFFFKTLLNYSLKPGFYSILFCSVMSLSLVLLCPMFSPHFPLA